MENPTSKTIHDATDRKVEIMSRLLHIGMAVGMPQFMIWPTIAISFLKQHRRKLYGQFSEFVDFHSDTKQLSDKSNKSLCEIKFVKTTFVSRIVSAYSYVFQPVFTIFFPKAILGICTAMLLIQMQIVESVHLLL